jgi:hypothetical protein
VIVRAYQNSDLERIKTLHRKQNFKYPFPDLADPVFAVGAIAEEDGEAQMAAFLKITAEAYLFLDPTHGAPRERWQTLLQVHEAVRCQAKELGLADVNLWAPPQIKEGFLRKLKRLGWNEDTWRTFTFRVR